MTIDAENPEGSGPLEGGAKRLPKRAVTALCPQHNPVRQNLAPSLRLIH